MHTRWMIVAVTTVALLAVAALVTLALGGDDAKGRSSTARAAAPATSPAPSPPDTPTSVPGRLVGCKVVGDLLGGSGKTFQTMADGTMTIADGLDLVSQFEDAIRAVAKTSGDQGLTTAITPYADDLAQFRDAAQNGADYKRPLLRAVDDSKQIARYCS